MTQVFEKPQKQGREKQKEVLAPTMFKPGQSGNPGGKPTKSRNRLQGDFLKKLADDFEENGVNAIRQCREEEPATYLRVVASLMPKEIEITKPMDEYTDEQLDAAILAVRTVLTAQNTGDGSKGSGKTQPAAALPPVSETA